jgi:hypothetical protein
LRSRKTRSKLCCSRRGSLRRLSRKLHEFGTRMSRERCRRRRHLSSVLFGPDLPQQLWSGLLFLVRLRQVNSQKQINSQTQRSPDQVGGGRSGRDQCCVHSASPCAFPDTNFVGLLRTRNKLERKKPDRQGVPRRNPPIRLSLKVVCLGSEAKHTYSTRPACRGINLDQWRLLPQPLKALIQERRGDARSARVHDVYNLNRLHDPLVVRGEDRCCFYKTMRGNIITSQRPRASPARAPRQRGAASCRAGAGRWS